MEDLPKGTPFAQFNLMVKLEVVEDK